MKKFLVKVEGYGKIDEELMKKVESGEVVVRKILEDGPESIENMTLMTKAEDKREAMRPFRMNAMLMKIENWTMEDIKKRGEKIEKIAESIRKKEK